MPVTVNWRLTWQATGRAERGKTSSLPIAFSASRSRGNEIIGAFMKTVFKYSIGIGVLLLAGCAFDVSHVTMAPVTFEPMSGTAPDFVLMQNITVHLGTGFPTRLQAGTHWHEVGTTGYGTVYATKDQIVTVEASDVYEARLIVSNRCVTGFYLPVEKMATPVSHPVPIEIQSVNNP